MPFLERLTAKITDRMPSMITPRMHSFIELACAGGFLLHAASAWERDKPVAVCSSGCAMFLLTNAALTDFAGTRNTRLGVDAHGRVDLGLAAMIGTIPSLMGIKDKYDARFFRVQAVALAALAGLTDFNLTGQTKQLKNIEKTGHSNLRKAA